MVVLSRKQTNNTCKKGGHSLFEILIAMSVFSIGTATVGYLIIDSEVSLRASIENTKATLLAREGLVVARELRDDDFDTLVPGTYGLALASGEWTLSSTDDVTDQFTRSISISDVGSEVKKVVSSVVWSVSPAREKEVVLSAYLSDWGQSEGDASHLSIDNAGAYLTSTSTELTGISLQDSSGGGLVLESISVQWEGAPILERISIGGTDVFVATSTVSSGDSIDIDDYTLPAGGTRAIDAIEFDIDVSGTDFMLTFVLSDGSRRHVRIEI